MTEISLPRIWRISDWERPTSSTPLSLAEPVARPFFGSSPMSDIDDCVLPDPDSPTMASTSPAFSS